MNRSATPCRACACDALEPILDLGRTPLANSLLTPAQLVEPEPRYPLEVAFCPQCALVQLTHSVSPERLFREYLYFSSVSDALVAHAREIAHRQIAACGLGPRSLALEIASNDGYLLQFYRDAGVPVLGIEPARNIASVAEERGIRTISEFFGAALARDLADRGVRASVLHANNVLAHVPDLNGFVEGIATVLAPDGVAVIEAPCVVDLIDHCEFDTIYHEHLCYFSLTTLDRLFASHGLDIVDVERLPIHGGSLRIFARAAGAAGRSESVAAMLAAEAGRGVGCADFYRTFARRVEKLREDLCAMVRDLRAGGARLAAYGAAAKGSTLLNYCGIGMEALAFVADRSERKQGLYMPGVHIPICSPDRLREEMPTHVLLLTWNFAEEIMAQQAAYRAGGGRFIVPVPEPHIV